MHDDNVRVAREELEQVLAEAVPQEHRTWYESKRETEATVLAFDVSVAPDGTRLEELAGVAIVDDENLYLAYRRGAHWQVSKPANITPDLPEKGTTALGRASRDRTLGYREVLSSTTS